MWASVDPTRPHPMITMCMIILPAATVPKNVMPCCGGVLARGRAPAIPVRSAGGTMGSVSHGKAAPYAAGDVVDVLVGEPVHGGWCVARPGAPDGAARSGEPRNPRPAGGGPVLFIRHALPGERVSAVITQTTAKFARADAIEIIEAAPERVNAPCPYARPGGCGGCDWQHASLPAQREIKARVISQQLKRIAGLERAVSVAALPGDAAGLGWRTRVRFAVGGDGTAGLSRHRSHEITPTRARLIAPPLVPAAAVPGSPPPPPRRVR